MNVLQITPSGFIKGINGLYELNLCDALLAEGVSVRAITLAGDRVRDYVTLCSRNTGFLKTTIYELEHVDYDIIHLHSALWSNFPLFSSLLIKVLKRKIPLILTTHAFDTRKMKKPLNALKDSIRTHNFDTLHFFLRINTYYLVNRVISMTQTERDYLFNKLNIPKEKLCVVPNGVNFSRFSNFYSFRKRHAIYEDFMLLFVGQLIPEKGIFFLLSALKEVLAAGIDCRLVVFTYSDFAKIAAFKSISCNLGVSQKLSIYSQRDSRLSDLDLVSAFKDCDVFILPSLTECFPGVLLEAMASSKPIIATDIGGIHEIVENGVNGFLVKSCDSTSISNKCITLLEDRKLRIRMGNTGFSFAKKRYDWNVLVKKIIKIYSELL